MAGFLKDINGICSSVLITCEREGNSRFPKGGGRRSGTSKRQTVVEIVQNGRVSSTARVSQPVNRNEGVLRVFARVFTRGCDGGRKLRGRTHLASGHLPRVDRGGTAPPPATKRRKGAHVVGTIIRKSMFPVGARIADRHPCLSAKNLELRVCTLSCRFLRYEIDPFSSSFFVIFVFLLPFDPISGWRWKSCRIFRILEDKMDRTRFFDEVRISRFTRFP